jgi:hypothetical protein
MSPTTAGPPKGYMGFNEREFYERKIERIEEKIEELERDPKFYFYEKSQQSDRRRHVTFFVSTGDGGFINTKTGEVIN